MLGLKFGKLYASCRKERRVRIGKRRSLHAKEIKERTGRLHSPICPLHASHRGSLSYLHLHVQMERSLISKDSAKEGN
jgi:hypothetical protein